jgi:hypothetical protein
LLFLPTVARLWQQDSQRELTFWLRLVIPQQQAISLVEIPELELSLLSTSSLSLLTQEQLWELACQQVEVLALEWQTTMLLGMSVVEWDNRQLLTSSLFQPTPEQLWELVCPSEQTHLAECLTKLSLVILVVD